MSIRCPISDTVCAFRKGISITELRITSIDTFDLNTTPQIGQKCLDI